MIHESNFLFWLFYKYLLSSFDLFQSWPVPLAIVYGEGSCHQEFETSCNLNGPLEIFEGYESDVRYSYCRPRGTHPVLVTIKNLFGFTRLFVTFWLLVPGSFKVSKVSSSSSVLFSIVGFLNHIHCHISLSSVSVVKPNCPFKSRNTFSFFFLNHVIYFLVLGILKLWTRKVTLTLLIFNPVDTHT